MTSLLPVKHMLYIGTTGGVVIQLDSTHWTVIHLLWGYDGPVQCLVPIHQGTATQRKKRRCSVTSSSSIPAAKSPKQSKSTSSLEKSRSSSLSSSGERQNIDRNMVLSFGPACRGIVGGASNHPPSYFLPSSSPGTCGACHTSRINCICDPRRMVRPDPSEGYVLYWSNMDEGTTTTTPTNGTTMATNNTTLESTITPSRSHDID